MGLLSSVGKALGGAVKAATGFLNSNPIIGTALTGGLSLLGGERANSANMAMLQGSQEWQENMYKTRYQMQTTDMLKADLNPMLAYGAAPPSMSSPSAAPQQDTITPAINSANQARQLNANLDLIGAQEKAALATAENQLSQARNNTADASLKEGQYEFTYGDPKNTQWSSLIGNTPVYPDNLAWRNFNQKLADLNLTDAQTAYSRELINEILPRIRNMEEQGKSYAAAAALADANERAVRLGLPKIQAESAAYSSAAGAILPFLPGISSSVNSANTVKHIFTKGR